MPLILVSPYLKKLIADLFKNPAISYLTHLDTFPFVEENGQPIGNTNVVLDASSRFGSGCARFNGSTSSYLSLGQRAAFDFGSQDFTLEFFFSVLPTEPQLAVDTAFFGSWNVGGYSTVGTITADGKRVDFQWNAQGRILANFATSLNDGLWHHYAVARKGATVRLFIDGILVASGNIGTTVINPSTGRTEMRLGGLVQNGNGFRGRIDEFRVVKGSARYTANFTPPTAPFSLNDKFFAILDAASASTTAALLSDLRVRTSNVNCTGARANVGKSSGKWYWEVLFESGVHGMVGLGTAATNLETNPYNHPQGVFLYIKPGAPYIWTRLGNTVLNFPEIVAGSTIGLALDRDSSTVSFYVNGVLYVSQGLPAITPSDLIYPIFADGSNGETVIFEANFGDKPFKYPVPTGYTAGLY